MHVPDGFLDAPTSVATGVVAAVAVALSLRGARRELDDRTAPMAGLVATFVFAAQMINFPVGAGTSGHLMGGALAAVLVGPWTAVLCLSRRAARAGPADGRRRHHRARHQHHPDGHRRPSWSAGGVFVVLRRVLPKRLGMVAPAAAVGALVSVPVAALVFTAALRRRRQRRRSTSAPSLTAMLGWHTVIGIGEAVVTGLVVAQRRRRPPRPRPRRPPAARRARARDPHAAVEAPR